MDLVGFDPDLDLFNQKWPIITVVDHQPCFKLMMTDDYIQDGNCPHRYMSAGGTVVTNPRCLVDVVFGRRVTVDKEAHIKQSVILDDVKIGASARITKTIIDSNIVLPDNCIIGESIDDDKTRNIRITEKGVRLVHAGSRL